MYLAGVVGHPHHATCHLFCWESWTRHFSLTSHAALRLSERIQYFRASELLLYKRNILKWTEVNLVIMDYLWSNNNILNKTTYLLNNIFVEYIHSKINTFKTLRSTIECLKRPDSICKVKYHTLRGWCHTMTPGTLALGLNCVPKIYDLRLLTRKITYSTTLITLAFTRNKTG